jgi:7-dehydrocholesterol reductase
MLIKLVLNHDSSLIKGLMAVPTTKIPSFNDMPIQQILSFAAFQLACLIALPGSKFMGPVAPSGFIPAYKDNGLLHFLLLSILYVVGVYHLKLVELGWIYNNLTSIMMLLNITSLIACVVLYLKGLYLPSTPDSGTNGNAFLDMYWGTELYPSFGVSFKQFWICRLGMVLWVLFAVSFAEKTYQLHGTSNGYGQFASVALQYCYILKFFYWERWYLHAADIAVDRMGFMLTWGTLCFMPFIHTLQNLHLVNHTGLYFSKSSALLLFAWGTLCTWLNYDSDTQRHRVRQSDGKCLVWGKVPRIIRAKYTTADGRERDNILLASGWNGLSRHFHYLPDILNLVNYCVPAGFSRLLPWTYCIYLTILLVDRTWRIDEKCLAKYGKFYEDYMKLVPRRLIPGLW